MSVGLQAEQYREWSLLYDAIRETLQRFGEEDDGGERRDYLLVDDNLGLRQHTIETSNPEMV